MQLASVPKLLTCSGRATRDPAGRDAAGVEDPEVREQAKRRRFSAEYKLH